MPARPIFESRHYNALAKWIHETFDGNDRDRLAELLCREFVKDGNPRFDANRFLVAAGSAP